MLSFRFVAGVMALALILPDGFGAGRDWPVYLGDQASSQYSELKQVHRGNVGQLEPAWVYNAGDARADNRSQIQCNPLVIDGVLYGTSPQLKLLALDAAMGRELWRFDPFAERPESAGGVNRGVVYWKGRGAARLLFTAGQTLHAVDARTGELVPSFGQGGRVDLREGLGRDPGGLFVQATTPGVLYRDLLIQGSRVSEGPGPSAPGHIRAYDVRTGKLVWRFHTIPQPGEPGYETWPPDAWLTSGGANVWSGMAVDERRGLVFCPTGSPAFDFWGGDRIGANLYANCLIALDARTGRRVWHYQFVRHDLWDRDLPASPNLVTVRHKGRRVAAVAQITKSGHVFVFNRETGEPLFPIEERPVPGSTLQGESTWPTQPFPLKPEPFSRQVFTEDLVTDISPESRAAVLKRFRELPRHEPFLPPSTNGTIIFPGFDGGAEWGGAAADPRRGILYVNGNEMPWVLTMVESRKESAGPVSSARQLYNQICAACHGPEMEGDPLRAFPSLREVGTRMGRAEIAQLIETGKGLMPGFAFLGEGEREALADYLLGAEPADRSGEGAPAGMFSSPYSHTGYNRFLDPEGYPAVKPPWGTLNAIDLNTGEYLWRRPLGEVPALTARGIPPTGTENYGGPVVTAGGLDFHRGDAG